MQLFTSLIRVTLLASALLIAGASAVDAQRPQRRSGFWIGLGTGYGLASASCKSCSAGLEGTESTSYIRLGGTLSQRFLLGVEFSDWEGSVQGLKESREISTLTGYYYPFAHAGLFIKGGVGSSQYRAPDVSSSGWALVSGAGYDLRVFSNISVTGTLNYWHGSLGRVVDDRQLQLGTGYRQDIVDFSVGITIH